MGILLLLLFLALIVLFWQGNMAAREAAATAARDTCRHQGLQLLDGTVALQGMSLTRNDRGIMAIKRIFQFSYSPEGASRQTGFVITVGNRVDNVGL